MTTPEINPDALRIGARVVMLREAHDPPYSQEDLAALANVSRSTIQSLEAGRRMPQGKNLSRIAKALGLTLAELREDGSAPLADTPEARILAERLGMTPAEVARTLSRAAARKRAG